MSYRINYAYLSNIGKVRANNEDNYWCAGECLPAENQGTEEVKDGWLKTISKPVFGVFDGMGGESCGEIAAHLSAETCGKWYAGHKRNLGKGSEQFWLELCREMNREVCEYAKENKIHTMGSTAAMLAFDFETVYACNLGDSRIYEWKRGNFEKISTDHILKRNLFGKAPLLQYVGISEENMILEPSIRELALEPGARYLLCSDGVTDMLDDVELGNQLSGEREIKDIAESICTRALQEGGKDNITLILLEVTEEKRGMLSGWFEKHRKGAGKGEAK